jgi:hypothetical protein
MTATTATTVTTATTATKRDDGDDGDDRDDGDDGDDGNDRVDGDDLPLGQTSTLVCSISAHSCPDQLDLFLIVHHTHNHALPRPLHRPPSA